MAFDNHFIDEVKTRVNIVDVIGREVRLKQAGTNYKGLCPFHSEKTPSFNVNEENQYYHCFGCGESGDVIRFVERYYNLSFSEAVEKICGDYNIRMPEKRSGNGVDYRKYYEINRKAARFFFHQLTSGANPGYSYLRRRGLSDATIRKFGLGYAPDQWQALMNYLAKEGISAEDMLRIGLIQKGRKGYYDKFRNRVMFPIINTSGRVIGFGGLAIGDWKPKYLNSPESEIFLKKNNLYALNITRKDISDEDQALMVEGYMDVISLYQNGVKNVTASLGTALTENQAHLIRRYTRNVVLSYDSDNAGVHAALRGIDIIRSAGCDARVLQIDDGKDPDEYIRKNGKEAFHKLIQNALPATDFRLLKMKEGYDFTKDDEIIRYIRQCVPILGSLSPVEQNVYVRRLAEEFGLSEYAIQSEIRAKVRSAEPEMPRTPVMRRSSMSRSPSTGNEERIDDSFLALCLANPDYLERMEQDDIHLRTMLGKKVLAIQKEIGSTADSAGTSMTGNIDAIYEQLDPEEEQHLKNIIRRIRIGPDDEKYYRDCVSAYRLSRYREMKSELQNDLATAQKMGNDEKSEELASRLMEVEHQIRKLRKQE